MVSTKTDQSEATQNQEATTIIDDVDDQDGNAYFEYALPFQVMLPADKVAPESTPQFEVTKHSSETKEGVINCEWQACVRYEEREQLDARETSTHFDDVIEIEDYEESTAEFVEEVERILDQEALPPWKETYTTYTFPLK